ncbi:MAG: hypothetical protein J6C59_00350 [Muribaculaceae bacterium]|nr:hypothetical protein [Muribaculaceae bacterium]
MFDVYFFGRCGLFNTYQEVPDSQGTVFKQMLKEVIKSKYSQAIMFKRLDNHKIYYSYIRKIGLTYFGIGIITDKSFDIFGELCMYFRNIIYKLREQKLLLKEWDNFSSNWIEFANSDIRQCGTEIGLFLSNLQPWSWNRSLLKPLSGSVGTNEQIIREFNGSFEDIDFKSLSGSNQNLLSTYSQLLERGYPNFFVGIKRKDSFLYDDTSAIAIVASICGKGVFENNKYGIHLYDYQNCNASQLSFIQNVASSHLKGSKKAIFYFSKLKSHYEIEAAAHFNEEIIKRNCDDLNLNAIVTHISIRISSFSLDAIKKVYKFLSIDFYLDYGTKKVDENKYGVIYAGKDKKHLYTLELPNDNLEIASQFTMMVYVCYNTKENIDLFKRILSKL